MFGKMLNTMKTYGCNNDTSVPAGWDRYHAMCSVNYYKCKWNDDGKVFQDDGSPGNYSTSVIGYECDHRTILFYSYSAFETIITI